MSSYPTSSFSSSRAIFDSLVDELSGEESSDLDHGELERRVKEGGLALMRALMQDHLDLRAEREKRSSRPMRGVDGELRTERRPSSRQLGTLFGRVTVHRLALVRHGITGGLRPLDAHLNLPVGVYSHGVQREVAWGVARTSYDVMLADLRRTTGATIAKRQAEELIVSITSDFEDYYLDQPPAESSPEHLVVMSFDGAGVVMRPEGLRAETRNRAKKTRRRSTAETAAATRDRSARRNRKRMAEVAAVFDLQAVPRTPEDINRELRRSGPHKPRPRAENKRVWASLARPIQDVVDEAFVEAWNRDDKGLRRWVAIVDGNEDQLRRIHAMAENYGVEVTIVVDFIHVLGYLWKAGKALAGDDVSSVEAWVTQRSSRILYGEASTVAAAMRRSATARGLVGTAREAVDDCARYLLNHKAYLRYHEYLRDGLPIASGVIEGACRSLVRDRMDITGARWGLRGGEAVFKLRSLAASGDLDRYLDYHAHRELQRNHLAKFDEHELVELRAAA